MTVPRMRRTAAPTPAPSSTPAGPTVGTTELATMYSLGSMVCGSDADSAASRKRLRLMASSTSAYKAFSTPLVRRPVTTNAASPSVSMERDRLVITRICRRDHRSRTTPTNGPTMENRKEGDGEHDGQRWRRADVPARTARTRPTRSAARRRLTGSQSGPPGAGGSSGGATAARGFEGTSPVGFFVTWSASLSLLESGAQLAPGS